MTPTFEDVLTFWLGPLDGDGLAQPDQVAMWWRKDDALDATIRARFGGLWSELMRDGHEDWRAAPRSLLAYVLVLDQLSRNMFRGKAQMFAGDGKALAAAKEALERGDDRRLVGHERLFLYMPFMHSERLSDQERCVELFTRFRDESQGALRAALDENLKFAIAHRDIVAQWGRFPHRNQLLDRTSTSEELAFLTRPGSSF